MPTEGCALSPGGRALRLGRDAARVFWRAVTCRWAAAISVVTATRPGRKSWQVCGGPSNTNSGGHPPPPLMFQGTTPARAGRGSQAWRQIAPCPIIREPSVLPANHQIEVCTLVCWCPASRRQRAGGMCGKLGRCVIAECRLPRFRQPGSAQNLRCALLAFKPTYYPSGFARPGTCIACPRVASD